MKVRHFKEETKIGIEDLDDLWYLKTVLEKGDEISGASYRRMKDDTKARADKGQRVRVYLTVRHEEANLHEHSKTLRITGEITQSRDEKVTLGSFHTLDVGIGNSVTIRKTWKRWQLDRLKEAEKTSRVGIVLIVAVEDGEADFAILRRYGIDYSFRITSTIAGKEMEDNYIATLKEFYDSVAKKIEEMKKQEAVSAAIICGPGFAKEKVHNILRSKNVENVYLEAAGCGGRSAIQEVLKRGAVEKVVEESRVGVETRFVEKLFTRITTDGNAVYGLREVENASDLGAIETLLVTYSFLQKHNPDRMLEKIKKQRGEILVVSPEHDAGERLDSIGGVGALLRFKIA